MRDPVDIAYDNSHYNQDAPVIAPKELANETSEQLDKLLANGNSLLKILFAVIYEPPLIGFNAHEASNFTDTLALLLNCPNDDRSQHIDTIRDLFKLHLQDEAAELAKIKLESKSI